MKRALLSVSDKSGLVAFAEKLISLGWEIIATGGTRKILEDNGLKTVSISDVTGFPEICDGRVKTLHPKVHGALLARRDNPSHLKTLADNGIEFIDLVCVNLYPFRATISREGVTMDEAIENIDIGGPSMLRSAAKNYRDVTVVCDPSDYSQVISEISSFGNTTEETRLKLSAKAYTHTAEYDICIAGYMRQKAGLGEKLFLEFDLKQKLRYGENPHQKAAFYSEPDKVSHSLASAVQIQGKELSYNNIQDANAALAICAEFEEPFCVALKHMNPCGAAVATSAVGAWTKAYEADKVSIYGGIVAFNREVDEELAKCLKPVFLEIVLAPSYTEGALGILASKKNLRVMKVDMSERIGVRRQYVSVNGGLLVQDCDAVSVRLTPEMCRTKVRPDDSLFADMEFGWRIVKHVKSNAIVIVRDGMTLGVGAGQMNRVASAEIALKQAAQAGFDKNLILASDGFLPFDDTVSLSASYGVKAIVQPGGSIRDNDCIVKADELGIAMLMTGERHFKH